MRHSNTVSTGPGARTCYGVNRAKQYESDATSSIEALVESLGPFRQAAGWKSVYQASVHTPQKRTMQDPTIRTLISGLVTLVSRHSQVRMVRVVVYFSAVL